MPAAPRVLVVEDDQDIRDTLAQLLELEGYAVRTAANGRDALASLRAEGAPPDVIVLDLMMPVMDGFEFRRAQLDEPAFARIPVVVFSADRAADDAARALGAHDALRKPVRLDDVLRVLADACASRSA